MRTINSIDLWTEPYKNYQECFNGAFIDGFEKNKTPFNKYKVIKNCNCVITTSMEDINISNKHNAIIFYDNDNPVRLVVINKDTEIENCINVALSQNFNDMELKELYEKENIRFSIIDMKEQAICNNKDSTKEIDVWSCDRWNLLYDTLKGSYAKDNILDKYEFVPNIQIKYELKTDTEMFIIEHKCAFINEIKTRIIPIQENSLLTR